MEKKLEKKYFKLRPVFAVREWGGKEYVRCECSCGDLRYYSVGLLKLGKHLRCKKCVEKLRSPFSFIKLEDWPLQKKFKKESSCYHAMISRCTNTLDARYGGRGIFVSQDWLTSFSNFLKDMGPAPSKKHSIERVDNNWGYTKKNCIWATQKQQARNTCKSIRVFFNGKNASYIDHLEDLGILPKECSREERLKITTPYRNRLKKGIPPEEVFATVIKRKNFICLN